ncbi:unnamed protein product [Closterium sp. Naga37s-1]|nr:unnamed protein product [Closterium sp. Naga37s-1]
MGWRLTDLFSTSDSSSATSHSQQTASHVSSSSSATHVSSTPSAVPPSAAAPAVPGAAIAAPTSRAASETAYRAAGHRYGVAPGGNSHMSRLDAAAAAAAAAPLATAPGATPAVIVLAPPQRPSSSAISPLPPSAFAPFARGGSPAAVPPLARPDASPSATPPSDAAGDTFFSPRDSFSSAHGFSARESSSPFSHHSLDSAHPSSRVSSGAVLQFVYAIAVVDRDELWNYPGVPPLLILFALSPPPSTFSPALPPTIPRAVLPRLSPPLPLHPHQIAYTQLVVRRALGFAQGFLLVTFESTQKSPRYKGFLLLVLCSNAQTPAPFPTTPSRALPLFPHSTSCRIAYTMLVVRRALGFARGFPLLILFAHVAALLLATWMGVWTFGVSGIMAQDQAKLERWWILLLFAMSIFWTAAVVCNMVHVVTAGVMSAWFAASSAEQNASSAAAGEGASAAEEGRGGAAVPPQQFQLAPGRITLEATWHALIGLGSICYGSLFSPPIHVIRWMIRGVRSWCIGNECFFFIINLAFNFIEALTRAFNAFGFVTVSASPCEAPQNIANECFFLIFNLAFNFIEALTRAFNAFGFVTVSASPCEAPQYIANECFFLIFNLAFNFIEALTRAFNAFGFVTVSASPCEAPQNIANECFFLIFNLAFNFIEALTRAFNAFGFVTVSASPCEAPQNIANECFFLIFNLAFNFIESLTRAFNAFGFVTVSSSPCEAPQNIADECFFLIFNLAFNFIEALTRAFNAFGFVTVSASPCEAPQNIANECFFLIFNLAFNFIEALTRAFNAFGFVTLAMYGRSFNRSSVDAWELFQSTGVEAVIAYDLSGAVLLMAVMLAAMVAGTAAGVWGWYVAQELVVVIGAMGIVTGAAMAGVVLSVVEGAVTATYVTAAEDPTLIGCVDAEFAAQLLDTLHQRLQHRSGKPLPPSLASDGLVGGVPAT